MRISDWSSDVCSSDLVRGYGASNEEKIGFLPFSTSTDLTRPSDHGAFYTVNRQPRALSARQRKYGPRPRYVGTEIFISLVDRRQAPGSEERRGGGGCVRQGRYLRAAIQYTKTE